MAAVVTKDGFDFVGDCIIQAEAELIIKLFKNDFTPDINTVLADFTEADFSGYTEVGSAFIGVTWDPIGVKAVATLVAAGFTRGVGGVTNTVYGWYAYRLDPILAIQVLVMCKRFSPPFVMGTPGDSVTVTPEMDFLP